MSILSKSDNWAPLCSESVGVMISICAFVDSSSPTFLKVRRLLSSLAFGMFVLADSLHPNFCSILSSRYVVNRRDFVAKVDTVVLPNTLKLKHNKLI